MDKLMELINQMAITQEVHYLGLIFALFVIPHILIRWNIASGMTAFLMGIAASYVTNFYATDETVALLASLGITSLFLFAGLEIEFDELAKIRGPLSMHVTKSVILLIILVPILQWVFDIHIWQPAALMALALLTPSTGFILNELKASPLPDVLKFWIRSNAIGAELVALVAMFIVLKSGSAQELGIGISAIFLIIFLLPGIIRIFMKRISPYAPNSDFAFFIMMAVIVGVVTKKLGLYYLFGAFIVGIITRIMIKEHETTRTMKLLDAVQLFSSFFIPFYFFRAGVNAHFSAISWESVLTGLGLILIVLPLRFFSVYFYRKKVLGELARDSFAISTSLLPNLIFGLVLANIMVEKYSNIIPEGIYVSVIIYTLGVSALPPFLIRLMGADQRFVEVAQAGQEYLPHDPMSQPK